MGWVALGKGGLGEITFGKRRTPAPTPPQPPFSWRQPLPFGYLVWGWGEVLPLLMGKTPHQSERGAVVTRPRTSVTLQLSLQATPLPPAERVPPPPLTLKSNQSPSQSPLPLFLLSPFSPFTPARCPPPFTPLQEAEHPLLFISYSIMERCAHSTIPPYWRLREEKRGNTPFMWVRAHFSRSA